MYEEYSTRELVDEIITDLSYNADIKKDYYTEWNDVGASSMEAFLEQLDNEQLTDTVNGLINYAEDVYENEKAAHNKAIGIRSSLEIALTEMYEFIHLRHDELTPDDFAQYDDITANDIECSNRLRCLRLNLETVKEAKFADE